jgi:hypothetical protein
MPWLSPGLARCFRSGYPSGTVLSPHALWQRWGSLFELNRIARNQPNHDFLCRLFRVVALPAVFLFMQLAKKNLCPPRLPIGRKASALAVIAPTTNLTTYPEKVRACASAPNAPLALVKYFDERGGFWRYGRVIASRSVARGRHRGRVSHTILTALNQQLTRFSDEVELVHDPKFKTAPVGADW